MNVDSRFQIVVEVVGLTTKKTTAVTTDNSRYQTTVDDRSRPKVTTTIDGVSALRPRNTNTAIVVRRRSPTNGAVTSHQHEMTWIIATTDNDRSDSRLDQTGCLTTTMMTAVVDQSRQTGMNIVPTADDSSVHAASTTEIQMNTTTTGDGRFQTIVELVGLKTTRTNIDAAQEERGER